MSLLCIRSLVCMCCMEPIPPPVMLTFVSTAHQHYTLTTMPPSHASPQITGRTPLHWASLYGRREVVELFCQRGCDVTVLDTEGRSAVHLAASSATTDALQALNKAFGNSILEMVTLVCPAVTVDALQVICSLWQRI